MRNLRYKIMDSDVFRLITLTVLTVWVMLWSPVDWLVSKFKETRKWK